MRVHRSRIVIPPTIGPVSDAVCASPLEAGARARHPGQAALDRALGVPIDDHSGTRVLCGGYVRVAVLARPDGARVHKIMTRRDQRGQGYARASMQAICEAADASRIPLIVSVLAMEPDIDLGRLDGFFRSLGFADAWGGDLRRPPEDREG